MSDPNTMENFFECPKGAVMGMCTSGSNKECGLATEKFN